MDVDNPFAGPPPILRIRLCSDFQCASSEICERVALGAVAQALLDVEGEAWFACTIRSLTQHTPIYELVPLPDQSVSEAITCALAAALRSHAHVAAVEPVQRQS